MLSKAVFALVLAATSSTAALAQSAAPADGEADAAPVLLAQAARPKAATPNSATPNSATPSATPSPENGKSYGPTPEQLKTLGLAARLSQSVFARDNITIGMGAGLVPSYEGSDQSVLFPVPVVRGSYKGYRYGARGPGLFVDLIKDGTLPKIEYIAGPVIRARLERNNRIRDAVVRRLGTRNIAIEAGATGGFTVNRIFGMFDSLTFQADAVADISGVHDGVVVSPSVSYSVPIKTAGAVTLSGSADLVDDSYADFYYSVTPAGSVASGLPQFRARGGLKSLGATLLVAYDLSGNALDGGWGMFALGGYSRMQGDFADSPIVSLRGDADQLFGGVGISYTF